MRIPGGFPLGERTRLGCSLRRPRRRPSQGRRMVLSWFSSSQVPGFRRGEHTRPRVLIAAPSPQFSLRDKGRDRGGAIASTRGACASQSFVSRRRTFRFRSLRKRDTFGRSRTGSEIRDGRAPQNFAGAPRITRVPGSWRNTAHRARQRANVFRRCTATTAHEIEPAVLCPLGDLRRKSSRSLRKTCRRERVRKTGVRIRTHVVGRNVRQLLNKRFHFVRAERAV